MVKIFISYRRADSNDESRQIYEALVKRFGEENIFRDKDRIPKGVDFRKIIEQYVFDSDEMLVIIGKKWLDIRENDDASKRRLDNPDDFVRIEIDMGLRHVDQVTPVVIQNATMPNEEELPRRIVQLGFQNAYFLSPENFETDLQILVDDIAQRHQVLERSPLFWRWVIALAGIFVIIFGIGWASGLFLNNDGNNTPEPSLTVEEIVQNSSSTPNNLSEEDVRATGAARAYATLTALAPTNTPTITQTPSNTPISSNDIQQTVQAEIFASETSVSSTQAIVAQETQNTVLTEQFNAGSTATYIAQLSLTPLATNTATITATNTPIPPSATFTLVPPTATLRPNLPEAERLALTGVTSNSEWESLVGEEGYSNSFDGISMVLVPTGCFLLGNDETVLRNSELGGDHCITEPFWIDKTEVTQGDFQRLGGVQANSPSFEGENHPVERITWLEARDFCELRNGRLPTEVEWEFASGGPDELHFPWGNDWNPDNANWEETSPNETSAVGSFPAGVSWIGAMDMSGNVWEWMRSVYESYPYDSADGREDDFGNDEDIRYVLRGGSWFNPSYFLRNSTRNSNAAYDESFGIGFRCVRSYYE